MSQWRLRPLCVTLLVVHCARCARIWVLATDKALLWAGPQRVALGTEGVCEWPTLRCPCCESADVTLISDCA